MYRVEQIKGRLVDRFSDELLRGLTLSPAERGETWDVTDVPIAAGFSVTFDRGRSSSVLLALAQSVN